MCLHSGDWLRIQSYGAIYVCVNARWRALWEAALGAEMWGRQAFLSFPEPSSRSLSVRSLILCSVEGSLPPFLPHFITIVHRYSLSLSHTHTQLGWDVYWYKSALRAHFIIYWLSQGTLFLALSSAAIFCHFIATVIRSKTSTKPCIREPSVWLSLFLWFYFFLLLFCFYTPVLFIILKS